MLEAVSSPAAPSRVGLVASCTWRAIGRHRGEPIATGGGARLRRGAVRSFDRVSIDWMPKLQEVQRMDLGPGELIVILAVGLLIFGSKRIPELARSMGRAIREFREGVTEAEERDRAAPASPGSDEHT